MHKREQWGRRMHDLALSLMWKGRTRTHPASRSAPLRGERKRALARNTAIRGWTVFVANSPICSRLGSEYFVLHRMLAGRFLLPTPPPRPRYAFLFSFSPRRAQKKQPNFLAGERMQLFTSSSCSLRRDGKNETRAWVARRTNKMKCVWAQVHSSVCDLNARWSQLTTPETWTNDQERRFSGAGCNFFGDFPLVHTKITHENHA
jgi:hypothetical protein